MIIGTKTLIAIIYNGIYNINKPNTFKFSTINKINFKGVIKIHIEIRKRNRLKEFFHKLHSKIEDLCFNIIMKIPDRLIPSALMSWMNRYTDKRIQQLKQQNIKQTWNNLYLEKAVKEISKRQRSL